MHPWPACVKKARGRTTGTGGSTGLPCAMVLTVSFALFPVTGLFCHRRFAIIVAKLSASVGAPEPHDFAVRKDIARPREDRASMLCVHRIPLPTFVTIAKRPSCECGMAWMIVLIWGLRQCPSGCDTLARRAKSNAQLSPSPLRRAGAHNHRLKLFFDGGGSSLPNNIRL